LTFHFEDRLLVLTFYFRWPPSATVEDSILRHRLFFINDSSLVSRMTRKQPNKKHFQRDVFLPVYPRRSDLYTIFLAVVSVRFDLELGTAKVKQQSQRGQTR